MPISPAKFDQFGRRYPGAMGVTTNALGSAIPDQPSDQAPDPLAPLPDALVSTAAKPPVGAPPFALPHPDTGGAQVPAVDGNTSQQGIASVLANLLNPQQAPQHGLMGFFDRVVHPTNPLGEFGKALLMSGGGPLGNAFALMDQSQQQRAAARQQQAQLVGEGLRYDQTRQDQLDERNYQHNKPEFFDGKTDRIKYDPATGTTSTVYDAPTDAQTYASTLGYAEGTPEYNKSIQDYVLRSYGPTAFLGRTTLEDQRAGDRSDLEDQRATNRVNLKGTASYRDLHKPPPGSMGGPPRTTGNVYAPILQKIAQGIPLNAGEQQLMDMRGRGGRRSTYASPGGVGEGATATGPGGKRVVMRGGQWVPLN